MKWALRNSIAFCVLFGSLCQPYMARNPLFAEDDRGAGNILTERAAADLFNALDLTRPELAPVAVAWKRNDRGLAQTLLAQYFRKRSSVGWKTESAAIQHLSAASRAIADGAVDGRLQGGLVTLVYSFPDGKIDWHFNATDHAPNTAHNDEWQWQLNRMSFWS